MAGSGSHSRNASESRRRSMLEGEDGSVLGAVLDTRQLEAFSRKVTATASHLMGDESSSSYPSAITSLSRTMRRPAIQRAVFSFSQQAPSEIVRKKLSTSEIAHRALTYIPDDQLAYIPEGDSTYSLFQGFQASVPESESEHRKGHRRRTSKSQKLLEAGDIEEDGPPSIQAVKKKRNFTNHRLEMMAIRKNMCSTEIRDIDNKIANFNYMRKIVLDRLANLETEELEVEHELNELDNLIEDMQLEVEDQVVDDSTETLTQPRPETPESAAMDASFMSESIYEKLPSSVSPKTRRRPKYTKRKSMPVLHEHLESGSNLKTLPSHNDIVSALDFDMPFGTMVTAGLDDTLRVWDLNLGRCMGFLEGHTASVRCVQVEDNLVASGSLDATIRLWDLSRARYEPYEHKINHTDPDKADEEDEEAALGFGNEHEDAPPPPPSDAMEDCPLFTLEAHVDEVTAIHLRGNTLVSGSSDKTLRQWDLVKGRCVQTLDVLWAAAQASTNMNSAEGQWRPTGRSSDANADFVGALQVFDAALACGTADGMVRLWDLRSGQVHRSLVGHTGPVTCLQFDDTRIVTASVDRSVRIWDLRTGTIYDAYAYDNPITSMMFDSRHIVCAAGEDVVKVYDKTDGRHWDCGVGANLSVEERMNDNKTSIVERVRIKDGYMIEGRRSGEVGVWTC